MDQLPLDGRITDLAGFARLGAEGVDLLLSDSTNAEIPGLRHAGAGDRPGARRDLRQGDAAGSSWPRSPRTCTGCSRCSTPPHEHGRKVALIGRSMVRNMGIARDLGLLRIPAGPGGRPGRGDARCRRTRSCCMSTGSQGEPMSALGRMATGDHRHITIAPGDTVVLASSLVPGNETAVYRVINQLSRAGAIVVHKDVAKVHVSGHAPAGELLYLLNVVKPSNLMPVHGEWRHLRAHARLGVESGVAADRVVLCEDGDVVDLVEGHAQRRRPRQEPLRLRGRSGRRRRRRVAAHRAPDPRRRRLHRGHRGGRLGDRQGGRRPDASRRRASPRTRPRSTRCCRWSPRRWTGPRPDGITDPHQLQQIVRRTVGRWVNDAYRRRPMIVPDGRRGLDRDV